MTFSLLFYTTLLSIAPSLYAMDIDEQGTKGTRHLSVQENADSQIHVNPVTEHYYERTYPFSPPKAKINEVIRDALVKKISPQQLKEILENAAYLGDSKSQERLYQLFTRQLGWIDLVSNEQAEAMLALGLEQLKPWAYWTKAALESQAGEVTKWHCLAANQKHPDAVDYVRKNLSGYKKQVDSFVLCYLQSRSANLRERLVNQFIQKWSRLCYASPFRDIVLKLENCGLSETRKLQLLGKAAEFGCIDSLLYFSYKSPTYQELLRHTEKLTALDGFRSLKNGARLKINYIVDSIKSITVAPNLSSHEKNILYQVLRRTAEAGYFTAIECLGQGLAHGFLGMQPDRQKAIQYLKVLHENGNANASFLIGCFYDKGGFGVQQNRMLAFQYFEKAARKKHVDAMFNVACLLRNGFDGHPPNEKKSLFYLEKAAKLGSHKCAFYAADTLMRGNPGGHEYRKALNYYKMYLKSEHSLFENEHKMAFHNIGLIYEIGQKPNEKLAFENYKKDAELGEVNAMLRVGAYCLTGYGRQPSDKKQALKWFVASATQGNATGAFHAGSLFYRGFPGQIANLTQATQYFELAGKLGHSSGYYNAALLYQTGFKDHPDDKQKAFEYFSKAADLGDFEAICDMGALIFNGYDGQSPDPKKAMPYLKKAAQLGDDVAMEIIGHILTTDEYYNPEMSKTYYLQAASLGNTRAMMGLVCHYLGLYSEEFEDIEKVMFWLERAHSLNEPLVERFRPFYDQIKELEENDEADTAFEAVIKESQTPTPPQRRERLIKESKQELQNSNKKREKPSLMFLDNDNNQDEATEEKLTPKKKITNPKFLRAKLREAFSLKKEKEHQAGTPLKLSIQAAAVAKKILNKQPLKNNELLTLFKDPFFQGQVLIETTKSGICIIAHNRAINKHCTYGDHRQHTKRHKGDFSPAFIANLRSVLKLFGITIKSLTM